MPMVESDQRKLRRQYWAPKAIEQRVESTLRRWRRGQRKLISTIEIVGDVLAHRKPQPAGDPLLASSILWQARAVPVVGGVPMLAAVGLAISVLLAAHLLVRVRSKAPR